jgi:multisubunit Na+/H+ antiporter MnhC subunit
MTNFNRLVKTIVLIFTWLNHTQNAHSLACFSNNFQQQVCDIKYQQVQQARLNTVSVSFYLISYKNQPLIAFIITAIVVGMAKTL